ncbi:hypothetical protein HY57_11180 [Dyella japonica A8]|uniref:Uncharacterized protein n=1 Tax=Dyella japonica A8 TaxID=1217721 RepID=A0A075K6K1_9GAMM|nr:hypothetical protein HY57_11180 [Dyella japonica A8]
MNDGPAASRRWRYIGFAISTAVLVPAWLWSGYWTFVAITRQHIIYGRWDHIVALSAEPQRFLLSLTAHAAMLITIPAYWMAQARKQAMLPEADNALGAFAVDFPAHHRPAPPRRPPSQGIDNNDG